MELYVYGLLLLFVVFPISDAEKVYRIAVVTDDFFIKKNSYSKFTGHIVDIIKEIAKDVKFKYKFYEVADGKHGEIDSQGNWNGLIGELQKGRADMIAAPMSINLEREKAVQFVTPFLTHGLTLLVKKEDVFPTRIDDRPPKLNFFLLPFEVSLWIMIIISGFTVAGYLSLMNRFNPYEKQITEKNAPNDNRGYNPLNSLWYTFTILFLQGYGAPTPKSIASRIVITLWWFISFFLAGFYLSGLVDLGPLNQTGVPTLYPKFKDIESAYMASIKMGVVENSPDMAKEFFDKTKIASLQKIKKELVLYKNMNAALAAVVNGTDLGLITDSLSALRFASGDRPGIASYNVPFEERCTLAAVGGIITERHLAFAGPLKNFDLKNQLDLAILKMKENQPKKFSLQGIVGYYSPCRQYTVGKDTYYPVTKENQDIALSYGQMKVDLKSTGGLFLLLLFGFVISSAVFVGEVMYYRSFSQGINDASNRLKLELEEE